MVITGDYLLLFLVVLALGLSFLALKVNLILFRFAAAIAWLTLGILFWTNQLGTSLGSPWVQVVSLVFLMMTIAVLTLQMKTDIRHERSVRGNIGGYPGASSESWTGWGPKKSRQRTLSAKERQTQYKEELKARRR